MLNFLPTIFRPIGEVVANQNSFGYALMPESTHSFKGEVPDSQKYWVLILCGVVLWQRH